MLKITKLWGAPGTGKTTRLIQEINKRLEKGYSRSDFVVTTFRKQMAQELKDKLGWDTKQGEGTIGTIHSICRGLAGIHAVVDARRQAEFCEMLGLAYMNENGNMDGDDGVSIITAKSKLGNLFFDAHSFLVNNMLDFSGINKYNDLERLENLVPHPIEFMRAASNRYTKWKQENGLADFDDMLKFVYDGQLTLSGRVLVVDEFQDLTPLQYAIIKMWSEGMEELLIAGDPRQTLYSYRGASAKFFEEHEGELVILDTTHRLPKNIWNYARKILKRASLSSPEIKTTGKTGLLKKLTEIAYYERLPSFTTNTLHLVRINEMGVKIAYALAHAGIPFDGISGWGTQQINLYNAIMQVRKALAGEDVIFTVDEVDTILEAYPKKYFSNKKTELRRAYDTKKNFTFNELKGWASLDIFGKRTLWQEIASDNVLINSLGGLKDPENLGHIKITHALKNYAKLITSPSVIVSTIHGAKGAEADFVFLHDALTKKISEKLYSDMDLTTQEAEAQVFYVGATRAKQALFIIESNERHRYALPDIEKEAA